MWDTGVLPFFDQKLLNTQCIVGRCAHKSPGYETGKCVVLKKKSLKMNAASHNNASWYTNTDGLLEHSLRKVSLYHKGPELKKIILFGGDPPCRVMEVKLLIGWLS